MHQEKRNPKVGSIIFPQIYLLYFTYTPSHQETPTNADAICSHFANSLQ